jgi:tetratricopeptide (TPR) repeat protein
MIPAARRYNTAGMPLIPIPGDRMRIALLLGLLASISTPLFAQLSTDEAMQRLRERRKAREAEQHAGTQPAQAADPSPATRPSAMQIGYISHAAWQKLEAKNYKDAAGDFDKLLKLDPKDTNALEGRAICRYESNQYKTADHDAEMAYNLSARSGHTPSRQTTLAFACTSIMDDNPMRTVKLIRGLYDSGTKPDNELQNVLGTSLFRANAQARKLPYFQESLTEYLKNDQALKDQRHDGKGRWGDQWIESGTAEHNWQTYEGAVGADERAESDYEHATQHRVDTEDGMVKLHSMRLFGDAERAHIIAVYNQAVKEEGVAKKRRDAADKHLASTSKPPFPAKLEPNWKEPR